MSKNSAADCPRLYVRSSQQLREFKVSNELLTHRVVITLCCSSYIVTFAIHTFNLHKILCLCVSSHYWNLMQRYGEFTYWGKSYYRYDFRVSFFLVVLYHCLKLLFYTIVLVILSDSSDAVSDLWQKRTLLSATNTLIYSMITLRFCQMRENVRYSCRKSDKNHTLNRHFSATSPLAILYALDDFSNV